jgi:DNA-binding MarR family transcriptional regulator
MTLSLRPSQALRLWHDVTLDIVKDGEQDLSARQTAILLTIYLEAPPHTVRGLAAKLGVTKPAITRALDTMGKLELVSRQARRSGPAQRASCNEPWKGALFVERFGDAIIARGKDLPI